jgi:hypothetical protein
MEPILKKLIPVNLKQTLHAMENNHRVHHLSWAVAIGLLVVGAVAFRYALPIKDGDTWYHILYGQYFWENKTAIADHTIFSWTPTTNANIYCTWLSDIFFFFYYHATGLPGLYAFRYLCVLGLVAACFLFSKRLNLAGHPVTWLFCLLAVMMSQVGIIAKPEMFTYVFICLSAWNWWHIRTAGKQAWKNCYLFPLLMLIWVNSHGGFIFGMVFLCSVVAGEILNTWFSPKQVLPSVVRKHLLYSFLLTVVALFITPYGYSYLYQLAYSCFPSGDNMSSLVRFAAYASPLAAHDQLGLVMLLYCSTACLLYLYSKNIKTMDWSSLVANTIFIFLYTRLLRTTFYFAPIFLFSALNLLATTPVFSPRWPYWLSSRLFPGVVLGVALCIFSIMLYKSVYTPELGCWMGFGIAESSPVSEAKYIKKNFPTARIGNTYNQGPYLMWELWPGNKIFIDSRYFPYRNWLEEYMNIFENDTYKKNPAMLAGYVRKMECDVWCIGHELTGVSQWFFLSSDWTLAYYGKNASVFVRKDIFKPYHIEFNADLDTINNLVTAFNVLQWTMVIQDWKATERVFARISRIQTNAAQREKIQKLHRLEQYLRKEKTGLSLMPL